MLPDHRSLSAIGLAYVTIHPTKYFTTIIAAGFCRGSLRETTILRLDSGDADILTSASSGLGVVSPLWTLSAAAWDRFAAGEPVNHGSPPTAASLTTDG